MKISLCMIVRNEEQVLERCLRSVRPLVDEIVICDTGSSDGTPTIAENYADVFFSLRWEDDFSKARNASFSKAKGDYLLWLDADDVIPPKGAEQFALLRERLERERPDVVFCPYRYGGLCYGRERVLKNCPKSRWRGRVHECIPPYGAVIWHEFTVVHLPQDKKNAGRNLAIYEAWSREEELGGRDAYYFGRELFYAGRLAEAETWLSRALEGEGWYVTKIEACKTLADCYAMEKKQKDALRALFRSFLYGEPRASVLCKIALLLTPEQPQEAAFWYRAALCCRDHTAEGDFEEPDCRTLTPLLGLCALSYQSGDKDAALAYHKKSEAIAPDHPSVRYNRAFFGLKAPPEIPGDTSP